MKKVNCITTVTKVDPRHHRSPIIIHYGLLWHFADFEDIKQLQFLADTLGFKFELVEKKESLTFGTYCRYEMDREIHDFYSGGFWKREQVPADAKPIKALSNGSIVTCYFTNDGEKINIYRPNPNAKEVYEPLDLQQQISHVKTYGLY